MGDKIFHWQYPGEEETRILNAVNYSLETSKPKYGTESGRDYEISGKAVVAEDVPPSGIYKGDKLRQGDIIKVYLLRKYMGAVYNWRLHPNDVNMNSKLTHIGVRACGGNSCECYVQEVEQILYTRAVDGQNRRCKNGNSSSSEPGIYVDSLHDINAIDRGKSYFACRNELGNECEFKVFGDNQRLAYFQKESVCPEVWEAEPKECPPGTCEVDCGNHICCYDSYGIPVDGFTK